MSTATSEQNLYAVLGVEPSASQEQIREQYRVLVRKYHPDLHPGDANAAHMMEQVNAAYEVLGNVSERRDYDAQLRLSAERPSQPYASPTATAGPQSAWNPVWGDGRESRAQNGDSDAWWEAMRAQERSRRGFFDDVWADEPEQNIAQSQSGWVIAGRVLLFMVRIIFGILFVVLRLLNTRIDDRDRYF
ncbi:MAG TPA: J domain-containing protein [Candidatus Cryosericum sp.]|nr:J domain-containing protein [Candidatus Cryosericum sp.]HPS69711.1 J domain-containing protein [Candidatus Cryosericum sp.]